MQQYNPYGPYYPAMYPQQPVYAPAQTSQPVQAQTAPPQIQNGGFVSVRNEMEARRYPVAIGNSVTFKDEQLPYVYVKTRGFSQLDEPTFEKFRLIREEEVVPPVEQPPVVDYSGDISALKTSHETMQAEITALREEIEKFTKAATEKPIRNPGRSDVR